MPRHTKAETRAHVLAVMNGGKPMTRLQIAIKAHLSQATVNNHLAALRKERKVQLSDAGWTPT